MTYQVPVDDIVHALKTAAGLDDLIERNILGGVDEDTIRAVIEEAGKFGAEVLEPLSAPGDRAGSKLVDGKVVTPPGWKEAYQQFAAGGWGALAAPEEWGGQNLPQVIATAAGEMWNSANLAFGLCPLLTFGAIDAIEAQGSDELKRLYLPKMVSGEWTGTMNLTEPHAGSDLSLLKSPRGQAGRRQLPHLRHQDLHHLRRPRDDRQHRAPGAGAPARCAARHARHLAVPGAEAPRRQGRRRSARPTMSSAPASSTSSASTPAPPA